MTPSDQDPPERPPEDYEKSIEIIKQRSSQAYEPRRKELDSLFDKKINQIYTTFYFQKKYSDQKFRNQIIDFRIQVFKFLLKMMAWETFAMLLIVVLDSLPFPVLDVDKLTLQVLVGATIAQISAMLIVIVKSVFSDTLNKLIMSGTDF